jgi:hypothetical protein
MTTTTVLSFPDRGQGGDSRYRGNCSPRVVAWLLKNFPPAFFLDPMVGGGTSQDVCHAWGVPGWFADLRQPFPGEVERTPIRDQVAWGFNLLADDIPVSGDLAFMHPPYGNIIRYSGEVWGDKAHPGDLSRCRKPEEFMQRFNDCLWRLWQSVRRKGHMAILIGDVVTKDSVFSPMREMDWPGTPVRVCVKVQHNVVSNGTRYKDEEKLIRQMHEYLLIFRRDELYLVPMLRTRREMVDAREREDLTWRTVVQTVLEQLGGEAELAAIYDLVTTFRKAREHPHSQEQVRRALQVYPDFEHRDRGRWALASRPVVAARVAVQQLRLVA